MLMAYSLHVVHMDSNYVQWCFVLSLLVKVLIAFLSKALYIRQGSLPVIKSVCLYW